MATRAQIDRLAQRIEALAARNVPSEAVTRSLGSDRRSSVSAGRSRPGHHGGRVEGPPDRTNPIPDAHRAGDR